MVTVTAFLQLQIWQYSFQMLFQLEQQKCFWIDNVIRMNVRQCWLVSHGTDGAPWIQTPHQIVALYQCSASPRFNDALVETSEMRMDGQI